MKLFFPLFFLFFYLPGFLLWEFPVYAQFMEGTEAETTVEIPRGREVVEIQNRADGRGFSRQIGVVKEFNRKGLELETKDGTMHIAANLVVRIHFQKSNDHLLGDQHFRQKNYRDALMHYKKALQHTDRRWVEVLLTERVIRCETALGFHTQAIRHFEYLNEIEPEMTDETFSCIPVAWQAIPGEPQLEETALQTLKDQAGEPADLVMSMSFLLFSPKGKDLPKRLKVLASNREERVAVLAEAQLWRLKLLNVTREEAEEWKNRIEVFPTELRGGPSFIIGEAFTRLKDFDSAALAFLKTAWVYTESPQLSQEALKRAKEALKAAGKNEEECIKP